MLRRKKWVNGLLIEGEKEAMLVAREEDLPGVNPDFDSYPVDITLPKMRTLWQAIKKSIKYSSMGIYTTIYKYKHKKQQTV